jgi:UDP-N-acetylglucosamine diphosphorylase/glucosamine-1-phosphate N-acetyltransferase
MNVILFDDQLLWKHLLPLTFTRPISEIRIGILKIVEKWQSYNWEKVSYLTEDYLQQKFPTVVSSDNLLINSKFLPDPLLNTSINKLAMGESLIKDQEIIACRCDDTKLEQFIKTRSFGKSAEIEYNELVNKLTHVCDIFVLNGEEIRKDFNLITKERTSSAVNDSATITYGIKNIFIEEGVKIRAAIINAEDGPVYIGKNAEIQEGAMIRGPFALGESSILTMGAKIRPNTTIGPKCKVGGEVSNAVIFGYSNKAHDGYIGNTVIGEWCNLGADTNTSNLKNNYSIVKIWNYVKEDYQSTDRQFCGSIIGDHCKTSINTMLNTGTVIGVGSNIFGGGFPPKFIPCFSWGGPDGLEEFDIEKNIEVAVIVMKRQNVTLTHADKNILRQVFSITAHHRNRVS